MLGLKETCFTPKFGLCWHGGRIPEVVADKCDIGHTNVRVGRHFSFVRFLLRFNATISRVKEVS